MPRLAFGGRADPSEGDVLPVAQTGSVTIVQPMLPLWEFQQSVEPAPSLPSHRTRILARPERPGRLAQGPSPRRHRHRRRPADEREGREDPRAREDPRLPVRRQRLHGARAAARADDRPLGGARLRDAGVERTVPRRAQPPAPGDPRRAARARERSRRAVRDQDDVALVAGHPSQLPAAGVVAAVRARRRAHPRRLGAPRRLRAGCRANPSAAGSTATTPRSAS